MPNEVDPVSRLIATASGWGGNPLKHAAYFQFFPRKNDGTTPDTLTLKDVPVDAFWSITMYDEKGVMFENEQKAYSVNSVTARPEKDGSFVIQSGGDPKSAANFLAIKPGWNYLMRLYRPARKSSTAPGSHRNWSFSSSPLEISHMPKMVLGKTKPRSHPL
jgi:hypothetical protein